MNLVAPKAKAKHELLLNKPASDHLFQTTIETFKYPQQSFQTDYFGENLKILAVKKVTQNVALSLGYFISLKRSQ
jgi:hypothetical protein